MSDKNDSFVGNYHLLAKLARGDIGDLYLARRQGAGGFEKLVIIKRIHQLLTGDPTLKKIFIDETFGSGSVEHPNIRQVYELVDTVNISISLWNILKAFHSSNLFFHEEPIPHWQSQGFLLPCLLKFARASTVPIKKPTRTAKRSSTAT